MLAESGTAVLKDYNGVRLQKVKTPFPTEGREWKPVDEEVGRFAEDIASYAASGLFASLVARPDLAVAFQRTCPRVTKWTVADDDRLVRFMSYISQEHDLELFGTLASKTSRMWNSLYGQMRIGTGIRTPRAVPRASSWSSRVRRLVTPSR